jgi:hypothetical protein
MYQGVQDGDIAAEVTGLADRIDELEVKVEKLQALVNQLHWGLILPASQVLWGRREPSVSRDRLARRVAALERTVFEEIRAG